MSDELAEDFLSFVTRATSQLPTLPMSEGVALCNALADIGAILIDNEMTTVDEVKHNLRKLGRLAEHTDDLLLLLQVRLAASMFDRIADAMPEMCHSERAEILVEMNKTILLLLNAA